MGQKASKPSPNVRLRVIGAGLSRTGTLSFTRALEILLEGPVYHGGTQLFMSDESVIKTWNRVVSHTPIRNASDRAIVLDGITAQIDGFVACTDYPVAHLVEELVDLYPDAVVICTVRDVSDWEKSMAVLTKSGTWWVPVALLPVPTMRHWGTTTKLIRKRWADLYDPQRREAIPNRDMWDAHIQWLQQVVPKDRLFFFDIRDGWEPLCRILRCDVPPVDFPKTNEAKALEDFMKTQVLRGLIAWAGIIAFLALVVGIGLHL